MASIYRPYTLFDTEQEVQTIATAEPYVGYQNTQDLPEGWLFDIKRWCSFFDLKLPTLPRLYEPSTQGLPEWDYFLSGVGSVKRDLKVKYLQIDFIDHEQQWIPKLDNGWYYRWKTEYFYYGDNSRVQYVDSSDNEDGRNVLVLAEEPETTYPILAASFVRDPYYRIPTKYFECQQMGKFSGVWVDGEQLETTLSSSDTVIWSNVDTNKNEFIVDRTVADVTKLVFNNDYIERVGKVPSSIHDFGTGDILGSSTGESWQYFYLSRFPVVPDTFNLYVVDSNTSTWQEWTRVDSYQDLLDLDPVIYPYSANYYFLDKDLGIVVFGGPDTGVPAASSHVVAMYDVTLRVEYEEGNQSTDVTGIDADTNPISQTTHQGYVCISHEELEAASITLKVDKDLITFSDPPTHGPVYVGNDYTTLKAEVLSPTGTPVPNIEVTFEMTPSEIGFLGGSSTGISKGITDGNGWAYSFYQPPVDAEEMGFYATGDNAVQGDTLVLDNLEAGLTEDDDIYLYKVLKDDPLLGMTFHEYLEDNLPTPPWWADPANGGISYEANYEKWKDDMVRLFQISEWTTTPNPNGRKVVVYNWDSAAINPILNTTGAFIPTRPISIDSAGSSLTYPSGALYDFDKYDTVTYPPYHHDIGAYWVCCTKYIEFRASCWSSYYNREVYSNTIRVKVQLPRHLLGEYVNEQLYKIPFGWKIYQDGDNNDAAGLDGATFLTINPHSGPYQIIDMTSGTVPEYTEEWVSASWSGTSFKITVT